MVDCGLKVIVALGLLMGPKEGSCYIWAVVFPIANCFRFCATMFISIIRLMSILVKKYQLECSNNWKLAALAFLVGPFLVCSVAASVAILPVQTIQGIGVYWCMVSSVYEQFKVLNLRSDTFGKRSYKISHPPWLYMSRNSLPSFAASSGSAKLDFKMNLLCQKASKSFIEKKRI